MLSRVLAAQELGYYTPAHASEREHHAYHYPTGSRRRGSSIQFTTTWMRVSMVGVGCVANVTFDERRYYHKGLMALELYHHGSSACAAKVRFALAEKRLEWTSHYVDILRGEQFAPAYLALNPKAVVPTLVHEGAVVVESTVICEYLEEVFADYPIYPSAPLERARVRVWTKAVDEELHPACSAITYVVSHRHTILRDGGVGDFEQFAARGASEGMAARLQKWQWIQQGLEAPGAADKIRLYDAYLHKMETALGRSEWLAGESFSMADIALAPYVNRLAALAMNGLWGGGRLPRVERWFERVRARPTFGPAFVDWLPAELAREMRANGEKSWPAIAAVIRGN